VGQLDGPHPGGSAGGEEPWLALGATPHGRDPQAVVVEEAPDVGRLDDRDPVAGLVTERRDGTRHWFRARPEGLAELRAFLDETWAGALDVARRLVEEDGGLAADADSGGAGGTTGRTG